MQESLGRLKQSQPVAWTLILLLWSLIVENPFAAIVCSVCQYGQAKLWHL